MHSMKILFFVFGLALCFSGMSETRSPDESFGSVLNDFEERKNIEQRMRQIRSDAIIENYRRRVEKQTSTGLGTLKPVEPVLTEIPWGNEPVGKLTEIPWDQPVAEAQAVPVGANTPSAQAGGLPKAQSDRLPPKWADIAAKPAFTSLSPEQQAEIKSTYFIAPRVGDEAAALRQKFLRPPAGLGFLDKIGDGMFIIYAVSVIVLLASAYSLKTQILYLLHSLRSFFVFVLQHANAIAVLLAAGAVVAFVARIWVAPLSSFVR